MPGATGTNAFAVSGNNVVGQYYVNGDIYSRYAFLYNALTNTFTTLDVPESADTGGHSISGSKVVGSYQQRVNDTDYGFLYDGSTYTILNVPGSMGTEAFGVSGNTVVGSYVDAAGVRHGFFYTLSAVPEPSTFTLLGIGAAGLGVFRLRRRKLAHN